MNLQGHDEVRENSLCWNKVKRYKPPYKVSLGMHTFTL